MTQEFGVFEPKRFYVEFVRRSFEEFQESPLDVYRVKMAVIQSDTMAERAWHHFREDSPEKIGHAASARAYRRYLAENECADFQVVWDVHDGHKHVELERRPRIVTSASQSGMRQTGEAFDSRAFSEDFDVGVSEAIVILDDGTERKFSEVLANVVGMWGRLVQEW